MSWSRRPTFRSAKPSSLKTCNGRSWPAEIVSPNFIRRDARGNAIADLTGSIARSPFFAGEPVRDVKLVKGNGSGFMAAILPYGHARDLDRNLAGDRRRRLYPPERPRRRDPVAPRERTDQRRAINSEIILGNVRVLAIDQTVEEKGGQKVVVGKTATLELKPEQSETLARSRQSGTLSLALRSLVDAERACTASR